MMYVFCICITPSSVHVKKSLVKISLHGWKTTHLSTISPCHLAMIAKKKQTSSGPANSEIQCIACTLEFSLSLYCFVGFVSTSTLRTHGYVSQCCIPCTCLCFCSFVPAAVGLFYCWTAGVATAVAMAAAAAIQTSPNNEVFVQRILLLLSIRSPHGFETEKTCNEKDYLTNIDVAIMLSIDKNGGSLRMTAHLRIAWSDPSVRAHQSWPLLEEKTRLRQL